MVMLYEDSFCSNRNDTFINDEAKSIIATSRKKTYFPIHQIHGERFNYTWFNIPLAWYANGLFSRVDLSYIKFRRARYGMYYFIKTNIARTVPLTQPT